MWLSNMKNSPTSELDREIERLVSIIHKSYKARVKWTRTGKWKQALQCEMGVALSMGRLDLLANLMERSSRIDFLEKQKEQAEYESRFSEVEKLPDEIGDKDSTLSSTESKNGFAEVQKE